MSVSALENKRRLQVFVAEAIPDQIEHEMLVELRILVRRTLVRQWSGQPPNTACSRVHPKLSLASQILFLCPTDGIASSSIVA